MSLYKVFFLCVASFLLLTDLNAQSLQAISDIQKARVELGRYLFYNADLSINGTMSCATCHEQKRGFADGNTMHPGALGDPAKRNVPGLANVGSFKNLTWANNQLNNLAQHALIPIRGTEPVEMGMNGYEDEIAKRLEPSSCYQELFRSAFPKREGAINLDTITLALETFQKTLISNNSLYDQTQKKKISLPTQEARSGEKLFFTKAKCASCHPAPLFSDDSFHYVAQKDSINVNSVEDNGLFDVTNDSRDKNFFRTPSLRNVTLSAPYWHNGSAKTLQEAIVKHSVILDNDLTAQEIEDLIAFLETLTDNSFVRNAHFSKPSKRCQ